MTLRCRKGDMAICNRTTQNESVGLIVEVREFVGDVDGQKDVWMIYSKNKPHPLEFLGGSWTQPDAWMTPIRPGDLQEHDETEKELTV